MGNFRSDNRGGSRGGRSDGRSGGFGGGRRGGGFREGGFRDRDSRSSERRSRPEMHEVTCDKCGKQCEVPFKPTESKPVFCSDCFRKDGDSSGSRSNFGSRNRESVPKSGISSEQFNQINAKLDRILEFLEESENDEDDSEEE